MVSDLNEAPRPEPKQAARSGHRLSDRERYRGVSGGVRVHAEAQRFPGHTVEPKTEPPAPSPVFEPCPLCSDFEAHRTVYHTDPSWPCPREGWPTGLGTLAPTVTQRADHLLAQWSVDHPGAARALASASGAAWTALRDAIAWTLETRP
jgi:hypothetical protein